MNITDLQGRVPAVVISPTDVVAITIDRYLSGQQMTEIQSYWQKRFPNNQIVVLQRTMSIKTLKVKAIDLVEISIDEHLSGPQLVAAETYWSKRFPNNQVIILQKSRTVKTVNGKPLVIPKF